MRSKPDPSLANCAEVEREILFTRDGLVAEHLGVSVEAFRDEMERRGAFRHGIEELRGTGRSLRKLTDTMVSADASPFAENDLMDPDHVPQSIAQSAFETGRVSGDVAVAPFDLGTLYRKLRGSDTSSVTLQVDHQGSMIRDRHQRRLPVTHGQPGIIGEDVVQLAPRSIGGIRRRCRQRPQPGPPSRRSGREIEIADQQARTGEARNSATMRRNWCRFHPGTNDKWVLATVNGPSGVSSRAMTAARGSSLHESADGDGQIHRKPSRDVRQPQHLPARSRKPGQQRDSVSGRSGLLVARRCDPGRPLGPRDRGYETVGYRTHRLSGYGGQIGSARALLIEVDLL